MDSRDFVLVKSIMDTIDEINEYIDNFDCKTYEKFAQSGILKRGTTMCLISISEMVDTLSDEFKMLNRHINFKRFKTLRNIAAHKYGAVNFEIVWEIITKNLPIYRAEFLQILNEQNLR